MRRQAIHGTGGMLLPLGMGFSLAVRHLPDHWPAENGTLFDATKLVGQQVLWRLYQRQPGAASGRAQLFKTARSLPQAGFRAFEDGDTHLPPTSHS